MESIPQLQKTPSVRKLMADSFRIRRVESELELAAAIAVRFRVFVAEQSIPAEEELDAEDATATHVIALVGDEVVGTGRWVWRDDGNAQIGRMAVDLAWRRKGVGGRILEFLEESARSQGLEQALLHSQEYAKEFYASHGYQAQGEPFLEVDILHVEMRKSL